MDERQLRKSLSDLPLGGFRFFKQTGSTNDVALAWATEGAADLSLVVADEQTSGRGRLSRRWLTPPGTALALSVILHLDQSERNHPTLFSGLGSLALTQTLSERGLPAQIKWPNDVLIAGRKTAGILVEAVWIGDQVESMVIGIGVNVLPGSVPPEPDVHYPATSIHSEGLKIDRIDLMHQLLSRMISLRPQIESEGFIRAWERVLAFMDDKVQVWSEPAAGKNESSSLTGFLRGLEADGALRLETDSGIQIIQSGEIHLRPV
jgi:BirA family transcriptional regulator, biotin operon repressor / biotin---[acetyl-CoA-carboxylase] ligase